MRNRGWRGPFPALFPARFPGYPAVPLLLFLCVLLPGFSRAARAEFRAVETASPASVRILRGPAYFDTLLEHIRQAEDRIDVSMFLFKTTRYRKNRPARIVRELCRAGKRGVRVYVCLERSGYDENINRENEKTAERLRREGIAVAFDSPGVTNHQKVVLIDDGYAFVGSHNFTHAALSKNNEISLLVEGRDVVRTLRLMIEGCGQPR